MAEASEVAKSAFASKASTLPSSSAARFSTSSFGLKKLVAFIGNIPRHVDDGKLNLVLEQCGRVIEWARMKDPKTGATRQFGFCEFADLSTAVIVQKYLTDTEMVGTPLAVNFDAFTKEETDRFLVSEKGIAALKPSDADRMRRLVLRKIFIEGRNNTKKPSRSRSRSRTTSKDTYRRRHS